MKAPIRLLLIDDHAVMRSGVANMLNANPAFRVVGEADEGRKGIELYRHALPDVVLLDVAMPGLNGMDTLGRLLMEFPHARVIMLSSSEAEEHVLQAMRAGASGYITKAASVPELLGAIEAVHAGGRAISPALARRLEQQTPGEALTAREIEVLNLLRSGLSNPDIARLLQVSRHTIKAHVAAILVKLGAADRTEAVTRGFERGILHL